MVGHLSVKRNLYILTTYTPCYKCLTFIPDKNDKRQTKPRKDCDILRLKGERITIRLPDKDLHLIDSFLEEEEFSSRSEMLRVAAKELIDRRIALEKGHPGESYVPISDDHLDQIDYLIKKGRFKSREAALFEIVRDYLESVEWEKIEKDREKLQDIKYQLATAKMTEKEIEQNYLKH